MLEGKTVMISGVGPGLGRKCAKLALRDGANVVITARRPDRLAEIAADLDTLHGSFDQLDDEAWLRNLEVNVLGAIRVARAVVPALEQRGGGSIVLIGSQASLKPVALLPQSDYAAAKSALPSAARDMVDMDVGTQCGALLRLAGRRTGDHLSRSA